MSEREYEETRRGRAQNKDLVLAPGEYAYMQDVTKGTVRVLVGPTVFSPTAQDEAVVYQMKDGRPFRQVTLEEAVQKCAIAVEGYYLVLLNPAADGKQPLQGRSDSTPELLVGRKVNIPGPVMFPLWPGQSVETVRGHHLRSNKYLLVRIYNEEEARANWTKAVIKPAADADADESETVVTGGAPEGLTVGKQYIIKGTEVSFYLPPTGVSVVRDEETGEYVREALTLERLEYCILVNEDGNKRYERGPAVVFPEPNETFITNARGEKKFRAIELNEIQGIYVKVIADYVDGDNAHNAGDELFITGADTPIYYPREEHSLIRYDGKTKHFATAIPTGEGRYVMNRLSGDIDVVEGPAMLLPDPRDRVFVHRVLTPRECTLWYPGNDEAAQYNDALRKLAARTPTTRGAISEGELQRASKRRSRDKPLAGLVQAERAVMEGSGANKESGALVADEFSRASTYTEPRSVTLNTKYQGVPIINVYTGYAVQVVSATGERRVVQGPDRILMRYDETLEVLRLSTGTPKRSDDTLETVYLRVSNNKVSDIVTVESSDHVKIDFKLSFLAEFTGDSSRWFEVENYVKLLTEHVRSVLAGAAKRVSISDLYANAVDFVRDTILGPRGDEGRPGMSFDRCGLRVADVEILRVSIRDERIARLLDDEQHSVVSENISLERHRRNLTLTKERHEIDRQLARENFETRRLAHELDLETSAMELAKALTMIENEIQSAAEREKAYAAEAKAKSTKHTAKLERERMEAEQQLQIERDEQALHLQSLLAETEAAVKKLEQFGPDFAAALTTLSNNETLEKVASALSVQQLVGGNDAVEVITKAFRGIPAIEAFMKARGVEVMPKLPRNGGNGAMTTTES